MPNTDLDAVYKALQMVPIFDGNPNVLTRFIGLCDQLVAAFLSQEPGSELQNLALLNGILNKVTGSAARTINSNGIPENWAGIRTALINNFSDQRDETALYNDLSMQSQGSSTPQEFYERCQTLFSTIMTYITLHEPVSTTIEAKRNLYKKLTMQAFIRGLKEPLGSRIRCMRPESIEKALEFVQEETNIIYLQQRNQAVANKIPAPDTRQLFEMAPRAMPMQNPSSFQPPARIWQPSPQPQAWRADPFINQPPRMPTRTQQMFRAYPPNYNPQSNVFKLRQRNSNQAPAPMSGVSHFVSKALPPSNNYWQRPQQHQNNPPPINYNKREINFNDCTEYNEFQDHSRFYDATDYYDPMYNDYTSYPYDECTPSFHNPDPFALDTQAQMHDQSIPGCSVESEDDTNTFFQKAVKSKKLK